MKGDFTRLTFRPGNHFSGVLLQQGRVQVDADWNEQVEIVRHREQTASGDVIGPRGGPIHDAGFALTCLGTPGLTDCTPEDIRIGPGRYYVDGILCENEEEVPLDPQPDLPGVPLPTDTGTYLAYLDVWERHLTAFERPDIREVALGGPDTATRTRTVWQVRLEPIADTETCLDFGPGWIPPGRASTGALRAQGAPQEEEAVDCLVPAGAGYRRIENQLYRVEIHDEGALEAATFKWSRDNGSVVAGLADIDGSVVTIDAPSKDVEQRFADAAAIELASEAQVLRGEAGTLVAVSNVEGDRITVASWPGGTGPTMADFGALASVRRWEAVVEPTSAAFIDLEDGVQVAFEAGEYRSGDSWVIPARSLDRTVQWPRDDNGDALPEPRVGIDHHYAPLATLRLDAQGWNLETDCRELFPPVTELTSMRAVGGDGQEVMPENAALGLPKPIEVGVANGRWPVQGATVRFQVLAPGAGTLTGVDADGDVVTNLEGIASAGWQLDPTTDTQQVSATLIDAEGDPVGLPVVFTANLSVARQVSYDPGACTNLQADRTVQSAIARLADLASLRYVSGDGQTKSADAAQALEPLTVAVSTPCGPVGGATVRFAIAKGNGTLQAGQTTVSRTTNAGGLATCTWAPDATTYAQQVTATLTQAGGRTIIAPAAVTFTANLSSAKDVAFDPANCAGLGEADTVQQAIDLLCAGEEGAASAIRIERVALVGGPPLEHDSTITAPQLAKGISIFCGGDVPIAPESVNGKPVCIVTVDLPYPFDGAEMEAWSTDAVFGFRPTILDGIVSLREGGEIRWLPSQDDLVASLTDRLADRGRPGPVFAHLTVKGSLVWGKVETGLVYLDGNAFGAANGGLVLPSGDGRRGGDFEMWFRIGG